MVGSRKWREERMTAQRHEKLIFNGKKTSMAFCPPIPENHPNIVENHEHTTRSTDCWRGYIGTWEIKDDKFFLTKLEGGLKIMDKSPILATWFTGVLRIPEGDILLYVHMGFGSVYEREIHIKVDNGIVTKRKEIDNRNKQLNENSLAIKNLPGFENKFEGDREL